MGFAFDPNHSDHNGIDDTAERTKDTIKCLVGPYCEDHSEFPECEVWSQGSLNHGLPTSVESQ